MYTNPRAEVYAFGIRFSAVVDGATAVVLRSSGDASGRINPEPAT